jgi:hypothetical protein
MALTVDARDNSDSATNRGAQSQTIQPLPDPMAGDQDVRDFPSNGAIPDQVRGIIPPSGYHVP